MANIIEEFLDAREFNYGKTVSRETARGALFRTERYQIDGEETLDGLELVIMVQTAYMNNAPFAQDFTIKSNRGVTCHTTATAVFEKLRMFI